MRENEEADSQLHGFPLSAERTRCDQSTICESPFRSIVSFTPPRASPANLYTPRLPLAVMPSTQRACEIPPFVSFLLPSRASLSLLLLHLNLTPSPRSLSSRQLSPPRPRPRRNPERRGDRSNLFVHPPPPSLDLLSKPNGPKLNSTPPLPSLLFLCFRLGFLAADGLHHDSSKAASSSGDTHNAKAKIVVEKVLALLDKDKDGVVTLSEFIEAGAEGLPDFKGFEELGHHYGKYLGSCSGSGGGDGRGLGERRRREERGETRVDRVSFLSFRCCLFR